MSLNSDKDIENFLQSIGHKDGREEAKGELDELVADKLREMNEEAEKAQAELEEARSAQGLSSGNSQHPNPGELSNTERELAKGLPENTSLPEYLEKRVQSTIDASRRGRQLTKQAFCYSPQIASICENLFYRQSMLGDYLVCPQMMLYKWVYMMEEEDTFFAAVAGTAGHSCIEEMHLTKNFQYSYIELVELFGRKIEEAIQSSRVPPKLSVKYTTIKQQCHGITPEYVKLLQGYQKQRDNQTFSSTINEQRFVLELKDEFDRDFLFTGMIDQAGFYSDGVFALRDIKFRANTFKPTRVQLRLNLQLGLYAYALTHGNPACDKCTVRYNERAEAEYNGPCDECERKIGTPAWPQKMIPEKVQLIWMRDYETYARDEYAKTIKTDEWEKNPATGRRRKKVITNPKWLDGYKKGDMRGEGILSTTRGEAFLKVQIADILRLAGMIHDGRFFRKEGKHCDNWCKHKDVCIGALEEKVQEIDTTLMNDHIATIDPFDND